MNAVAICGGIAGNMIPDVCTVEVNYRFAPSVSGEGALAHVREVFTGFDVELLDVAPGARPGLDHPVTQEFLADRKSTRLNSSHVAISYAVFCLKNKKN